ncbi:MAG TPA: hypothetical protein VGP25_05475 [Gemmatimonadaceae bacterium]|nr:hypothetical protein [Gemmatimonadaceae bacterium]
MTAASDLSSASVSPRTPADRRFDLIVFALYAACITLVSALHEPWKDETQSWRMAIDSDGVAALVRNARYEGHPLLFHLLLQLLGHLSRSWWAAVVLHIVIACAAAWVLLRYSPFTRLERALVVAGYFPAYEYAVIVRPYSLTMLLAAGACAAWTARTRRTVLAMVLLVLLANTTAMGLVIALAAGGAFALDLLWRDDMPLRLTRRQVALAAASLAALGAVAIFVALQVVPPANAAYRGEGLLAGNRSAWHLGLALTTPLRALTPIASIGEGTVQWNNWVFRPPGSAALLAEVLVSAVVVGIGCFVTLRRRTAVALYLAGSLGLVAFFALVLIGYARHHGHLVIVWIMAVWLSRFGAPTVWPRAIQSVALRAQRWAPTLFVITLVPMVIAAGEFLVGDAMLQFSDARGVATFLRTRSLDTLPMLGISRSDAQSVAALLDRPVINPLDQSVGTFLVWGTVLDLPPTEAQITTLTDTLLQRHCAVAMIATRQMDVPVSLERSVRMIYESPDRPMSANWFRVWLQSAPPSPRCPSAPGSAAERHTGAR